jgi:hypothetical protein
MDIGDLLTLALQGLSVGSPYPDVFPDGFAGSGCVYTHFRATRNTFQGPSAWQNERVQIDCYAASKPAAADLAVEVSAAMGAQSPYLGSPTIFSSLEISSTYLGVDQQVKLHRHMLEFSVWYQP